MRLLRLFILPLLACSVFAQAKPVPIKITVQIIEHLPKREALAYVLNGVGRLKPKDIILLQLPKGHEIIAEPKGYTFSSNATARGKTSRDGIVYPVYRLVEPKGPKKPASTNRAQLEAEIARLTTENKKLAEAVESLLALNNALQAKIATMADEVTAMENEIARRPPPLPRKPRSDNPTVEILSFDWKVVEQGSYIVKYSWKVTLANYTDAAISVCGEIDFLDKTGFKVDYEPLLDLTIPAKSTEIFTGLTVVTTKIAEQIDTTKVSIHQSPF